MAHLSRKSFSTCQASSCQARHELKASLFNTPTPTPPHTHVRDRHRERKRGEKERDGERGSKLPRSLLGNTRSCSVPHSYDFIPPNEGRTTEFFALPTKPTASEKHV